MRLGPKSASLVAGALALGATLSALAVLAAACSGGSRRQVPVATLASSAPAAAAFTAIRDAWGDPDSASPSTLRPMIQRFLAEFPADGLVPLARVALALVAMEQGDFETADAQLALTVDAPAGTMQDLRTVARARRLRARGQSEEALALLRPLVGKNVDSLARSVFEKELTLDALATHRDYEAISYMDAWLRATPEEERPRTAKTVMGIVRELPREVVESELQAMRTEGAAFGYGVDIQRILAARLVEIATTQGDARLARLLLDPDAGAVVGGGEAGAELAELATSRRGLNVVDGRTVGLLLPTGSPGLRDEAADVLRGIMWALGLPRGVRAHAAGASTGGDVSGTRRAGESATSFATKGCAPPQAAPDLAEPDPREELHLLTRDDSGDVDRTEVSLDELAGGGAAIIVAGLEPATAERALRWGDARGVPVIALVSLEGDAGQDAGANAPQGFGFLLGEARGGVLDVLARAAPALDSQGAVVVPLIDTSEAPRYPLQGGTLGPFAVDPPVSCDIPPVRAGEPRFPIAQWDHDKRRAWLVSGSPTCSIDLVTELASARDRGVVALTLEAAALPAHPSSLRVVVASAGVIPEGAAEDARDDELRQFKSTLGRVGWWAALGRDAATLARVALAALPVDWVSDPKAVAERRTTARDRLASAAAHLWSTEATGWAGERRMKRTMCALDSPVTTR
jgi:predicted negative regulator of RcsB-dependent stress response